ncbi:hypothetical protein MC885_012954 [Smutsia gigantea]|nr:hypothetical protein MC885_012954 [Smutsia gigantea]
MCSLPMARYYIVKGADQKALYVRDGQLLVGDPEADSCSAEKICVLPNRGLDRFKVPIFLGTQGGSRCLACVETREGPSLQLEDALASLPRGWIPSQVHMSSSGIHPLPLCPALSPLPPRTCRRQDVNIEELYKGGEQMTRFTFFQRSWGSAFRLEAAAWPGWFLCGPAEFQKPVRLSKENEPSASTEFYFEQSR